MKLDAFRARFPERQVTAGRLTWGVIETKGKKGAPTLVLVPGTLGMADIFWNQIVALSGKARVISITVPPSLSIVKLADGLKALFDKLGVDKAHLLGSSLGGFLIQHFAARHPERIEKLYVANTLLDPRSKDLRGPLPAEAKKMTPKQHLTKAYANIANLPAPDAGFRLLKIVLKDNADRLGGKWLKSRVLVVRDGPAVPVLKLPQSKIIVLDCGDDPVVAPKVLAAVRKRYPKAQRFHLEIGGHFPYVTRPQAYIEFFKRMLG
ncbi:MAG: alpha/beta hydrolase [Alphaproteobacteria bacterium]|nr:alpha/beta hydrolase [Alphaproteobacteria bacterium]